MVDTPSPEQTSRFLRWLRQGSELAQEFYSGRGRLSHKASVWHLLVESVTTMSKMPDQEARWMSSGSRSGGWNLVGLNASEAHQIEIFRILSSIKTEDTRRPTTSPDEEERCMDVLGWLNWCNDANRGHGLKKAAVMLAGGSHPRSVHRFYAPHRPYHQAMSTEIKTRIGNAVTKGLASCGIIPVGTHQFAAIEGLQAA